MKSMSFHKKLLSYFSNMRLVQKFLLFFLLAWIIPMIISSYYVYQRITDNLVASQIELAYQGYQQVKSFLTYRLERIFLTCRTIAMDSQVNEILSRDISNYTASQQMRDLSNLRVYLEQFQSHRNGSDILRLYVPGGRIYSNENKLVFNLETAKDTLWYKKTFSGWGWTTCNPPGHMETEDVVSVVRPIRDFNNYQNKIGAVRIDISLDEIESMLSRVNITNGCLTYIIDRDGVFVGASDNELLPVYRLSDEHLNQAIEAGSRFISVWEREQEYWVCASEILETGWLLVTVLPEKELAGVISKMQSQYIISISILFIVVFFLSVPAINSITKRIELLVERMKLVQEGNLSARLEVNSEDEIGQLTQNFNFMLERIKVLMRQQYKLGQELKTSELKALQAQINPHFLYNTLEMIGWLALEENPQQIRAVVRNLAEFYRLSLNRGETVTTIDNELKLVESYMYIQSTRFRNRIQLTIDVNPDILGYSIPNTTLQPIVENAIVHGILEKPTKSGNIIVEGSFNSEGMIELSVIDNGVGMSADQLEKLKKGKLVSNDSIGYGIKNIEKRLHLFFGNRCGVYYESKRNEVNKVKICIPPVPYEGQQLEA